MQRLRDFSRLIGVIEEIRKKRLEIRGQRRANAHDTSKADPGLNVELARAPCGTLTSRGDALRAPRRLLQRNGFPEERAAEVLEVEAIIDIHDRATEGKTDIFVFYPRDMPVDGRAIEQG